MSEESIQYPGPLDRIFWDWVRPMGILEALFGSDLGDKNC